MIRLLKFVFDETGKNKIKEIQIAFLKTIYFKFWRQLTLKLTLNYFNEPTVVRPNFTPCLYRTVSVPLRFLCTVLATFVGRLSFFS